MSRHDAIERIKSAIGAPETVDEITDYLTSYSGRHFETLGGGGNRPETADRVVADDILAVAMLSVVIPPDVVVLVLERRGAELSALLSQIPACADLRDASDEELTQGPSAQLWKLLASMNDNTDDSNRWVTAGKLLARKRPRLVPVFDRLVKDLVKPPEGEWWLTARDAMLDPAIAQRLRQLRVEADVGAQVTTLRLLDIALWQAAHR